MSATEARHQTARDRRIVAEEAGLFRISFVSILAGTLAAYGAFAIVAALVGGILSASDVDTDFSTNDWASTGAIGGFATGVALLLAYIFGGYVAGRMARRSGLLHGLGVAILSIIGGGLAGALISTLGDSDEIDRNLTSIGVPTSWDEWDAVAVTTAVIAVGAVIVGSVVGGVLGDRWHARLLARAADPERGRSAAARQRMEEIDSERDRLVEQELRPAGSPNVEYDRDVDHGAVDLREDRSKDEEPRYTAAEWDALRSTHRR